MDTCQKTLLFFLLIFINSRAENSGSVFFLDSPKNHFFRTRSPDDLSKTVSMLLPEVGAAVSVLLGFAPPAGLSASSSSKLNEVLVPNPFRRPYAVFMLEVTGIDDSQLALDHENSLFSGAFKTKIISHNSNSADIQLPGKEEVYVVFLNEVLRLNTGADCTDQLITDLASWLGGSYIIDSSKPLSGELSIPLASGVVLKLHMSKKPDQIYIKSLVSLIHNIRSAINMHEELARGAQGLSELMIGNFDGVKALQDQYGLEGVALQGVEILFTAVSKIFDSLQAAYKGELVGIIFCNEKSLVKMETSLNVIYTPRSRSLVATTESYESIKALEVIFVRRTLAWLTGVILLIATSLGMYFLLNMPLTRDSLLYSNVKLD